MHRLIALYHPPDDTQQFRSHLIETHIPLVAKFPGLLRYEYGFDVSQSEQPSAYYAVVTVDFESAAAMQIALSSPEAEAAAADVPNYAAAGVTIISYEISGSFTSAATP